MDLQCDQAVEPHSRCRSRLKIRRSPSFKISATSSSSFHGSSSCRQQKKGSKNVVSQPLIFHTVEPEIIKAEPAEFMWVVQMRTGSPDTRRLLRTWMRKSKETQSSLQVQDVQLSQEGMHSMQESNDDRNLSNINDLSPCPSSPNPSENIKHPPELALSSPNPSENINHPPELALLSHANQLIRINQDPLSPNSSLTTSSEGYHTDNLSTEAGASPYREALCSTSEAEEDGSNNFFVFSLDSYYGNYDGLEFHHSNGLGSFSQ